MIIRYTLFQEDEFGNGALKRTHQISTILLNINQKVITVSNYPARLSEGSIFERMKLGFEYYSFFGLKIYNRQKLNNKAIDIISWRAWLSKLKEKNKELIVIYELSYYADYSLIFACNQLKIKIIGLPHNLESLVWGQKSRTSNKIAPNWFNEEIKILNLFSKIYTISREEQWLLNLYELSTSYLPYYPSDQVLSNCLEVREKRKNTKKDFYLSFGTASNLPTLEGFKEIIDYYKASKIQEDLVIAGYDTDKLKEYVKNFPSNIKLKGAINSEELAYVFSNCKAIIIFQKPTTGALTKITELLFCGIPIICNIAAARTFFNINGIYLFNSKQELKSILKKDLKGSNRFKIPLGYYNDFLNELNK